eukprot:3211590-Ditylum_brightwellii.AAC.1
MVTYNRATVSRMNKSIILTCLILVVHNGCDGLQLFPQRPQLKTKHQLANRYPIFLRQTPSNESEDGKQSSENNPLSFFESVVHQVTGDTSYKFGDLTKKTLTDLTGKDLEEEGYQFGDISKNLANQAGRVVTGDESYQFGDITKSKLAELEKELEAWKEASTENLNAVPNIVAQTYQGLTPKQRKEILVWVIRLMAIGLLTFGAVSNVCSSVVLSMAWVRTSLQVTAAGTMVPILPFCVDVVTWRTFLSTYTAFKLFIDPLLL